ncbi:MAG TPA: hypothetical protein VE907_23440 [Gammaproteobacteria bacterium]|nr:hypothetical protein [Gammaproteobacteria bacterium]
MDPALERGVGLIDLGQPNGSGQMTEHVRTADPVRDGSQLFVKLSYLLQR